MIKKAVFLIFLIALFAITLTSFFHDELNQISFKTYELMKKVDSKEEALSLSQTYNLDFIEISRYGIASYQTDNLNVYNDLINLGFSTNELHQSETVALGRISVDDPYRDDQYALDMLNIDEAWEFSIGSLETVVAVIDSGIDINHSEFLGRISPVSYNAKIDQVGISFVDDDTGHGTMVAGIIGALTGNGRGISGIMQEVTLLVIKANNFDDPETPNTNEADYYWDSTIADSIYYAVEHGADVINLSLGSDYANPVLRDAINHAYENNVAIVAASGNDGLSELIYPASFNHVVSVSSVNRFRQVSTFANYNEFVDISAPGEEIITTSLNNTYVEVIGTSFAAPQVAGILGLLISYDPTQQVDKLYERIFKTAVDRGNEGLDIYYGYGIVDAYQAMLYTEYQVSLVTGVTGYPTSVFVNYGETFGLSDPFKEGYTFKGWYRDQTFTTSFNVGTEVVLGDITLYAKFEIISYQISFVLFDHTITYDTYDYQTFVSYIPPEIEGYTFFSWYYNEQFTLKYDEELITRDLTLYAKYDPIYYEITYIINQAVYYQETLGYGVMVDVFYPPVTQVIITDWYIDNEFTIPYVETEIFSDLTLYGKIDAMQLRVNFYDLNQTTLLYSTVVSYGESVTPPSLPTKEDSETLDFTFIRWSESTGFVENNMNVYPVYDIIYHPEKIYLIPGLDTVYEDEVWIDQGVVFMDDRLNIIKRNRVETAPGRYEIYYDVYYLSMHLDRKVRIVNVIDRPIEVKITMKPDVTTFEAGQQYYDAGVSINVGNLKIVRDINPNVPGVYTISYQVTYLDTIYYRTKYIYVLARVQDQIEPLRLYRKEDEVNL